MKEETIYFNSLKKIKDKVKHLLIKHPKTRDNDNELVCWFWYYECTEVNFHHKDFMPNKLSMLNFLSQYKKGLYTNSDNITRVRRKLQELDPGLRGENYKKRHESANYIKNNIKKL